MYEVRFVKPPVLPPSNDDPTRRRPDCTRVRERLAWRPRVSLPDGLRNTVEYFRQAQAMG